MVHSLVVALAAIASLTRTSNAWTSIDGCSPMPAACVAAECCPASAPRAANTRPPGLLPAPPALPQGAAVSGNAAAAGNPAAPANADAIAPPPLNRPAIEPPAANPAAPRQLIREVEPPLRAVNEASAVEEPAAWNPPATAADAPAADDVPPAAPASRYSTPPAASPAAENPADFENVFEEAPADAAGSTLESENEAAAETDGPAPAVEAPAGVTPAGEVPPPDDVPGEPSENPRGSVPGEEDLFGPTTSLESLRKPGGWESDVPRTWKGADGQSLAAGQISGATGEALVLTTEHGSLVQLRYEELSADDLGFLREQVAARRKQLAEQLQSEKRLLARQQ
jgi:hypothetical protein